jgi:hypothetical protein
MKKLLIFFTVVMLAFTSLAYAGGKYGPMGPAPNLGDCISDGSEFDTPNGPNDAEDLEIGNGPMGPAPNSGDGVPDGSGFEAPNGPPEE